MALTKITATNIGANAAANNIGYTPVNKAGDVMTGTLNVVGNLRAGYATDVSVVIGSGAVVPNTSVDAHILWGNDTAFGGVNGDLIYVPRTSTGARHRFYTGSGTPVQRMMIDELGRVTMPSQPMFDVYRNSGNVAASSTIVFNGIRSNIGSCYSTSTGRFTAPVAGAYQFNTQVTTVDSGAFLEIQLAVNGNNRYSGRTYRNGSIQDSTGVSACIYLSAGDYVTVTTSVGNAYGVDERCALFSGHLIG